MAKTFKKGAAVHYVTPRGIPGTGKITEVIETLRGFWYVVRDTATGTTIKLRASSLELV